MAIIISFAAGFATCVALTLLFIKIGAATKQESDRKRVERHRDSPWRVVVR
jgi:hypothetical protein